MPGARAGHEQFPDAAAEAAQQVLIVAAVVFGIG
jgi:hypothetical protein